MNIYQFRAVIVFLIWLKALQRFLLYEFGGVFAAACYLMQPLFIWSHFYSNLCLQPPKISSLTTTVAKWSDITKIGNGAFLCRELLLEYYTESQQWDGSQFQKRPVESVGTLKRGRMLLRFEWSIAQNCQLLDDFFPITNTTSHSILHSVTY